MRTLFWSRTPGKFVNRLTGKEFVLVSNTQSVGPTFQGTICEWYETLVETIIDLVNLDNMNSNKCYRCEPGPDMVMNYDVACILMSSYAYKSDGMTRDKCPAKLGEIRIGNGYATIIEDHNVMKGIVEVREHGTGCILGHVKILDL